jgi:hypothetical protein
VLFHAIRKHSVSAHRQSKMNAVNVLVLGCG